MLHGPVQVGKSCAAPGGRHLSGECFLPVVWLFKLPMRLLIVALFGLLMTFGAPERAHGMPAGVSHVTMMAASPDGRYIAVATSRGWLTLWDLSGGRPARAIKAHDADIMLIRFVSGGKQLLTGADDHSAKIWSVPEMSNVHTIWTSGIVTGGAPTPDGDSLLLGLWDGTVQKWDLNSGDMTASIQAHLFGRVTVDVSPSGAFMVTGGSDQTVRKWDAKTLRQIQYFSDGRRGNKAHLGTVYDVFFLDEDRVLSSASRKSFVITHMTLWDAGTGQPVSSAPRAAAIRGGVSFSADASRVVYAEFSEDHAPISVVGLGTWKPISTFRAPDRVRDIEISPNGRLVMTGANNGRVGFWDAGTGSYLGGVWADFDRDWGVEGPDGNDVAPDQRSGQLKKMLTPYLQDKPQ